MTKGNNIGLLLTGDFYYSSTGLDKYGKPYLSKKHKLRFTRTVRNLGLFQHVNFPAF